MIGLITSGGAAAISWPFAGGATGNGQGTLPAAAGQATDSDSDRCGCGCGCGSTFIENKDDNQIDGLHVGKVVLIHPPSSYPPGTYVIRRLESDGRFIAVPLGEVEGADPSHDDADAWDTWFGNQLDPDNLDPDKNGFEVDEPTYDGECKLHGGSGSAAGTRYRWYDSVFEGAYLRRYFSGVGQVSLGMAKGAWESAKSTGEAIRDPAGTIVGVATALWYYDQTIEAIRADYYEKSQTVEGQGMIAFDVLETLFGGTVTGKVTKLNRVAKAAEKAKEFARKAADAARKVPRPNRPPENLVAGNVPANGGPPNGAGPGGAAGAGAGAAGEQMQRNRNRVDAATGDRKRNARDVCPARGSELSYDTHDATNAPEGPSFFSENVNDRIFRRGQSLIEYVVDGDTIEIAWAEGLRMDRGILDIASHESGANRIFGYVTDGLGAYSHDKLQRYADRLAESLGSNWKGLIREANGKRYIEFIIEQ